MNKRTTNVDYSTKTLEVKNLKKYFFVGSGRNKLTVPAVDNVSFDIYKREVFGLVGESGCGKTTTGRTIIKLYKPTDGSVDLNGNRVTGGYLTQKNNINKIKKDTVAKILSYKPNQFQKHQIKEDLSKQIELFNYDIDKIKADLAREVSKAKAPIEEYKAKIYQLSSLYKLERENIKYNYEQKVQAQHELLINSASKEYKTKLHIIKNTYERKVIGLKDSAALDKETIDKRLVVLKQEYDEQMLELESKYQPLIAEAEAKKLSKADIKPELIRLKEIKKQAFVEAKSKYETERANVLIPDSNLINLEISRLKAEANEKIAVIKLDILKTKREAKNALVGVSKEKEVITPEQKENIKQIKIEAKALIEQEQEKIRFIKHTNRSKESLEVSRQMQMIFQDPISSLNPRMTVKEIVGEGLIVQGGFTNDEIDQKVAEALELVGLSPEFAARYPHEFSGGQRQRIGIARALIMKPNFIIADEPISSLDVSIRAQIINLLTELRANLGLTILFIAHDLSVVRFFCDRIAVMYYGKIVEMAPSEELFAHPMHPYTISLLSSIPQPDPDYEKGRVKIDYNPRMHDYRTDKPTLREIAPGHSVYVNNQEFDEIKRKYDQQNLINNSKVGGKK